MTKQHVLASTNCPKCGKILDGNGKNCIDCNIKEGHQLIRDTLKDEFNNDFKEKYRGQCIDLATFIAVPVTILICTILWLMGQFYNPTLMNFIQHDPLSIIILAPSGYIFYVPIYYLKKHSLYKKFVNSFFK